LQFFLSSSTLSENLTKCAAKIDFSKILTDSETPKSDDGDKKEDEKDAQLWPWDSVRNKLKDAYTEICVLSDVLTVAKEKRYMVLDPVPKEEQLIKPMAAIYARKKALANAANMLMTGADRIKNTHKNPKSKNFVSDFHIELLRLRQNWRLKKVSNTIIGDLSYRTAGSKFMHSGMFEVTKADEQEEESPPSSPSTSAANARPNSALNVNVPSELQGVAYIKVITQKDQEDLCTATVNLMGHGPNITQQVGVWQKTLEFAQNVLFCKELFNQLAREAVQLQAPIPHVVVG
jgi:mediator of RNA polymerase II transcription subunit 17